MEITRIEPFLDYFERVRERYAALGRNKEAVAETRLALAQAPNEGSRQGVEALIKQLEAAGGSR
ncbi:MAG TPA: hypothetical protein VKM72_31015 [Thermoanaerobaculia bacterium]|nr:hypothetical protein [Thermoanaerobaculia bacterium]